VATSPTPLPLAEHLRSVRFESFAFLMEENELVMDEIRAGLAAKLEGVEDEIFDTFYREMKDAISGELSPASFGKALMMAQDEARIQARTLVTRMVETEMNKIARVVAEGMADGLHPFAVARRLSDVKGLDSGHEATYRKYEGYLNTLNLPNERREKLLRKEFERLLKDRRKVIAQTEAAFAAEHARKAEALALGAKFKMWITVGDDRVSDLCASNLAAGVIGIKEGFPSGHYQPPGHPRCRCTLGYAISKEMRKEMERESKVLQEETERIRVKGTDAEKMQTKVKTEAEVKVAGWKERQVKKAKIMAYKRSKTRA
jgi:hypothetical protein